MCGACLTFRLHQFASFRESLSNLELVVSVVFHLPRGLRVIENRRQISLMDICRLTVHGLLLAALQVARHRPGVGTNTQV